MRGLLLTYSEFQSTPPRGGRHTPERLFMPGSGFNPRPRAGGDCYFVILCQERILCRLFANLLPTTLFFFNF